MLSIFKNISGETALAYDNLKNNMRVPIPSGEIVVVEDNEARRLRGLPTTFKFERIIEIKDLIKQSLQKDKRPYSSVMPNIVSNGKVLFFFSSEGGRYLGQRIWELQIGIKLAQNNYSVHFVCDNIPAYAKEWPGSELLTWERVDTSEYTGFDFVVGTPPQNLGRALNFGEDNGIPTIFICGELVSDTPGRSLSPERILELDSLYKKAKMVIAPSESMKDRMIASGVDESKITIIAPTVNPQLVSFFSSKKVKLIPEVLICSRLDYHKQLVPTVRQLLLHPLRFDIRIITNDAKRLTSEIGQGNDNHKIYTHESITEEEKAKILANANVLIHPSLHEGFGMTVLEALVMGLKVVAPQLDVYKKLFGNDIIYYQDESKLYDAVSESLTALVNDNVSKKYRKIAQEDKSISLGSIFKKKNIAVPTNSKKVLVIGTAPRWGGGELSKAQIVEALDDAGFETYFALWKRQSSIVDKNIHQNIFSSIQEVRSFIEKNRPGFVIVAQRFSTQIAPLLQEFGIPFAILFQFWTPFLNKTTKILEGDVNTVVNKSYSHILSKAEFVIANSDYTASVIKKFYGVDSVVIYPSIDKKRLHGKPGRTNKDIILTTILEEEEVGLNLYKQILKSLPNRKFVVLVFRGSENAKRALTSKHKNLTILDGVKDVAPYFHKARVYLYPLQVDHSYGRSFCEAVLTGVPIVSSNLGNPPVLFPKSGKWLDTLDANVWVKEIEKLFTNSIYRSKRVEDCKKEARTIPEPNFVPLVSKIRELVFHPQAVVLTNKGKFMAGTRHFTEMAKIIRSASFETGESDNLVFYGPPRFQMELVSTSSYCYWASTLLESQIDRELPWLDETIDLVNKNRLGGIIFADKASFEFSVLKGCKKSYFLRPPAPNINNKFKTKSKDNHVSLLFSVSPRKNILNQLLAIQKVGGLTVHTLKSLMEQIPHEFTENINFVRWEHLQDDKFFKVISGCKAGLQVSIGESFDFAAFEHLLLGVPCLVGRSVKFTQDLPRKYADILVVNDIDDADEIATKLKEALSLNQDFCDGLASWAKSWGKKWNKKVKEEFNVIFS